jgi:hypothetical protein
MDEVVVKFQVVAEQLEIAAEHARTASEHFKNRRVPPGCAHHVALEGHLLRVREELDAIAVIHAAHAEP